MESWYWEVWNEPNGHWKGTQQEFLNYMIMLLMD
ncbi:MAG: hypothetical protein ABIN89_23925 [Chitinophagaceae bacterium]